MGVKVTLNVSVPTDGVVPAVGPYRNVPGTEAVAFNCVALKAVPNVMAAGVAQVMTGAAAATTRETVLVAMV